MKVNCLTCLSDFEKNNAAVKRSPNHFCSRSCAATKNNLGVCRNPKKPRPPKKVYHKETYEIRTIGEYRQRLSVNGKHRSWIHSHIRDFARNWNKHLKQHPCQVCGYSTHVELAHIVPISKFTDETTIGEINNEKNILVLCPNHHWEFDNGLILVEQIPIRSITS